MKKFFSLLGLGAIIGSLFVTPIQANEAPAKIHHFAIITTSTTKVGQAIDVTVEARDKDDKIIEGYVGSIFFQSTTDFGATLPAQGKSVQFKADDKGKLTLSKAVSFKRSGVQNLTVTETFEDAEGTVSIQVDPTDSTSNNSSSENISIVTPDNNSTITSSTVTVSGKTTKNSKVILNLNGSEAATTTSDEEGLFSRTISNVSQDSNVLEAVLVDGSNNTVAKTEVRFSLVTDGPKVQGTTVSPTTTDTSEKITITTNADAGLSEVTFMLNGSSIRATEADAGKYSAETVAPSKSGTYPISVILKNNLGKTTSIDTAATLSVNAKSTSFEDVKVTADGNKATFNWKLSAPLDELNKFKIAYGASADRLSEEVMTYELDRIKKDDGSYEWYIDNLTPGNYTFQIFGTKSDGSIINVLKSEPLSINIGKAQCTIGNVGKIRVTTSTDKSILSWETVTGAISYNVYKITPAGDYELIQNTKDTEYTIHIASGALVYEDFALRALCDTETTSAEVSKISKVQTGPAGSVLAALVVIASLGAVLMMRRKFI